MSVVTKILKTQYISEATCFLPQVKSLIVLSEAERLRGNDTRLLRKYANLGEVSHTKQERNQ